MTSPGSRHSPEGVGRSPGPSGRAGRPTIHQLTGGTTAARRGRDQMRGSRRTTGTGRRTATRGALAAAAVAVAVVATPGVASAGGTITPLVDCYTTSGSQTTLVLGYANTKGSSANYDVGGNSNHWTPAQYDGDQPGTFDVGVHHGVYQVTLPSSALSTTSWTLGSTTVNIGSAARAAGTCPAGTTLPATGNGTGPAIALAAAGLVGVVAVRRSRRRALPATSSPDSSPSSPPRPTEGTRTDA